MLTKEGYLANLELVSTVKASGCVVECGVWKGGTSAGMAEVLGPDREYFLFDSFQGHLDPQPIDGPAAFAWKADKHGPWYFDNAVVALEVAGDAMRESKAGLRTRWRTLLPRPRSPCCGSTAIGMLQQ
jgi:O-methyltransferase